MEPPTTDIRDIPESHLDQALDLTYLAHHLKPPAKTRAYHRALLAKCTRIGAYEDDQLVGLVAAHPFTLSLPGGELPCAVLDFVSVAPTHRRRGLLTAMIGAFWSRCAAAGQPLASLWASESAIYGRYGFASATEADRIEIDATRPLDLRIAPDPRPLRLIDPADAPAVLDPLYEASRARRAGRFRRDERRWRTSVLALDADDDAAEGFGAPRVVVLGAPGETPGGYAVYRTRGFQEGSGAPGAVSVRELEADDAPAAAALWSYLAGIDLTTTVRAGARPADDPLFHLAADRDRVRITGTVPCLWLRLVDVPAALTARSWAAPVDLVLDVRDTELPANAGRLHLTATPDGAHCTPTTSAPDITLDARELAACYLGGTRLRDLVRAGLATEHTPGAARRLDAALETEWLPATGDDD
ncbi:GNAT family N-acetyltransferase [Streptomyces sp. NPDC048483]|uniref:GNAT family N-acetyltransferase n=1 Tax=Streptomyces sp. NPDC048483 TaxID=3154927 RepID=UPI0034222996